jgi:DNA invertase Pin-like site-specific DNA recombinase
MSTDHQQYSIDHQREAIAVFAGAKGYTIVRSFIDAGRSGLTLHHREGLCELLSEVASGRAAFRTVLVYDVSRWGRFQDSDEAACYEFMCKRAGIEVVYCMEQFPNDGSPMSSVLKGLKRVMAGEYSRELSRKVHAAQCRMVRMGFAQGGPAAYGLRRQVVDATGKPRGSVGSGERKFLQSDRVVLVPGPPEEQTIVRWIFAQVAGRKLRPTAIALELARRRVPYRDGTPWTAKRIRGMLANEQYIGNLVYNRGSTTLGSRRVLNPPERWVRAEGVIEPIITPRVFRRAQEAVAAWSAPFGEESAIAALRDLLAKHRRLSGSLINAARGIPSEHFYREHFGGLAEAYGRAGYRPRDDWRFSCDRPARLSRLGNVRASVLEGLRSRGCPARAEERATVCLPSGLRVAVLLALKRARYGRMAWTAQHGSRRPDLQLLAMVEGGEAQVRGYLVVSSGSNAVRLREPFTSRLIRSRSQDLGPVLDWLVAHDSGTHV